MKKYLCLLLFPSFLFSQNFSGEIVFREHKIPKESSGLDSLELNKVQKTSTYLIKNGFYKSTTYEDGIKQYSYTYDNVSKRMHDEYVDKDYITYRDSRKPNYEYGDSQIYRDSTITVLGRECYLVTSDAEFGYSRTYYSDAVRVDPEAFKEHRIANWYEKLKLTNGAISMYSIYEYDDHFSITEVVKITERPVADDEFDLPLDKPILASYSALDEPVPILPLTPEAYDCYISKVESANMDQVEVPEFMSYAAVMVNVDGSLEYLGSYEEDPNGFFEITKDIVENCEIRFKPGRIDQEPVQFFTYVPVRFKK